MEGVNPPIGWYIMTVLDESIPRGTPFSAAG
jgi:hypothetical protein